MRPPYMTFVVRRMAEVLRQNTRIPSMKQAPARPRTDTQKYVATTQVSVPPTTDCHLVTELTYRTMSRPHPGVSGVRQRFPMLITKHKTNLRQLPKVTSVDASQGARNQSQLTASPVGDSSLTTRVQPDDRQVSVSRPVHGRNLPPGYVMRRT